jgi:ABC-type uncharacterized transport system permease subunit
MRKTSRNLGLAIFAVIAALFFVTPLLWFIFAPFNPEASLEGI